MATETLGTSFRRLLRRIGRRPAGDLADGNLLERFAARRDQVAFSELVQRHGPMVIGVCRRVLHDIHGAEDAFQATFLILARKAAALEKDRSLGNWLYTVARNTALKARASAARRRDHERQVAQMRAIPPATENSSELLPILDAELGALPESLRAPLVLCYLQGKSHLQAAQELGWPAGSMAKRLARGLEMLRKRLASQGVALSGPVLAALLAQQASAAVPSAAAQVASRSAVIFAGGQTGAISPPVAALAHAGLQGMATSRSKLAVAALLGVGLLGSAVTGVIWLNRHLDQPSSANQAAADQPLPLAEDPRVQETRAKLARKVSSFEKGIDPNTPLKDALEYIAELHKVDIQIDSASFEKHGVQKIEEQPIDLPPIKDVKLSSIFRMLLGRINQEGGSAGYHIRPDGVVEVSVNVQDHAAEGPPEKALVAALAQPVAFSVDENTPLKDALQALSLKVKVLPHYIDVAEFWAVGIGKPEEMPLKARQWTNAPLGQVLRELLQDVESEEEVLKTEAGEVKVEAQVGSYILREEYVEIVPIPKVMLGKAPLPAKRLQEWWGALGHANPREAFRASRLLAAIPEQAVPYLGQRVRPVPPLTAADQQKIARLIQDLESNQFTVRQQASAELEKLGGRAEPALLRALADKPSLDFRERLERLVGRVNVAEWPRARQTVRVLERIGSLPARQHLRQLANGAADARLTREAQAALDRLAE